MAQTAASPEMIGRERRINTGQLAWGILVAAFAVFCVLCVISGVGMNYFLFRSMVPMQTTVVVGRGTVTWTDATLIPQATRGQLSLFNSAVISTDPISQATIFVYDHYYDRLVATITLKNDSTVDVEQAARPRFDWSSQAYNILLENASGELDVMIAPDQPRETTVTIRTAQSAFTRLIRAGQYTVRVTDDQLQVINFAGEAIVSMGENPNFAVPPGQRGTMQISSGSFATQPSRANWLGSMTFETSNIIEVGTGEVPREQAWGCNNQQNELPAGFYALTVTDGINALRLGRGGGANSHGETTCSQYFSGSNGQQGRDISGYGYLGIRATFKIVGHSLSTCGTEGSECPLMLRMEYVPENGGVATWYHGFYTRIIGGLDYPLRCTSCTIDHEIINENAWYTYDSGNLLALIPPEQRPRSLLNFRFYASGHEYDVFVSEMALLVGQTNPVPAS